MSTHPSPPITGFVFWQNMPTHLQSAWIVELAERAKTAVRVAVESDIPDWRRGMGWAYPDYGSVKVEIGLQYSVVLRVIDEAGPDAVHVFSGLGAYPGVNSALRECARRGYRLGILSESAPTEGLGGAFRNLVYRIRRARLGKRVDFILAIGEGASSFFKRAGFDLYRIFEFAYFPPLPQHSEFSNDEIWLPDAARLLYIGQLIYRKGVDRLLSALDHIHGKPWHLALVGTGDDEPELREFSRSLSSGSHVTFCGAMENPSAMAVLRGADVLVLPSRFDGYGAVVNEALCRGVPVICSSRCGARQVVGLDPALGTVFEDESSLETALDHWISKGRRTEDRSREIRKLAQCVSPATGADYFFQLISHIYAGAPRPVAPWRRYSRLHEGHGV